jgi:hypothetical protein
MCVNGFERELGVSDALMLGGGGQASSDIDGQRYRDPPTHPYRRPNRHYTLTPGDIAAINPTTKTAPSSVTLATPTSPPPSTATPASSSNDTVSADDPAYDPWQVDFMSMFHMTNDSGLFHDEIDAEAAGARLDGNELIWPDGSRALPLYEGKMIWPPSR